MYTAWILFLATLNHVIGVNGVDVGTVPQDGRVGKWMG
jgi:hypothetical protein